MYFSIITVLSLLATNEAFAYITPPTSSSCITTRQTTTTTTTISSPALISSTSSRRGVVALAEQATMADSGVPPTSSDSTDVADTDIPSILPSDVGMDYIPLATMLATGQLAEADQFTRDALITLSGAKSQNRDFVYFTDVKRIPSTDLATIERLWNRFSNGKFGYSVQKRKWRQSKGDFELFCRKIGWTTMDGDVERKKRWFGASEFIYDVKKAPEGHLPLTSALRGTSLLKNMLSHPVWDDDEWMKQPEK